MIKRDTSMFNCDLPSHKSTLFRLPTPRSISSLPKLKKNYPSSVSSQTDCKSTTKHSENVPSSSNSEATSNIHWECCRIVNLRIPLPSGNGVIPRGRRGQTVTGQSDSEWYPSQRRQSCGDNSQEKARRMSTPKLKHLELLAFSDSPEPTDEHKGTAQDDITPWNSISPLAASSFLTPLMQQTDTWRPTPRSSQQSTLTSHHSSGYPSLNLSSVKLRTTASETPLPKCTFRYSHRAMGESTTFDTPSVGPSSEVFKSLPDTCIGDRRSSIGYTHLAVQFPPLATVVKERKCFQAGQLKLQANGHSIARHSLSSKLKGRLGVLSSGGKGETQASYPDPLCGGPPAYHKRLSQMAMLVSETVHWERLRKAKKSKSNVSQKSLQQSYWYS